MKRMLVAGTAVLTLSLAGYAAISLLEPAPQAVSILAPIGAQVTTVPAAAPAAPSATVSRPPTPTSTAPAPTTTAPAVRASPVKPPAPKPVGKPAAPSPCATNTRAQFVLVSISQQHAWMCSHTTQVYDSPVTTGASALGDDTPSGTWPVQAKQGARDLTVRSGASYHVQFWIPYDGDYGFHDAAWQTFPEGSPLWHSQGSHGCVHLPLTAMTWLYHWVSVGATVTVRT